MLQGIYAISDEILTPYQEIFAMLQKAIEGGISIFQFRDKSHQDNQIESLVAELMDYCEQEQILFVLNDRIELAMKLQTKGLHIGKKQEVHPYSLEELYMIRKSYGGILGISCYGDLQLAQNAKEIGADYIAFGSCFASPTKTQAKVISLDLFQKIQGIKKCAIGGINQQNIHQLQNVDMVACISSIWKGDIIKNIDNLKRNWKNL
ncbi:thiamine phosphate synthase [Helicobacter canadensis]|uniref:Thiamine monophosphate synthase n=1 Tax=Helicobacter canadensis MIT 98-5491 TaxID=537970 RepID=C5ZZ63_9HELI|nr:thiamine phosphate synthase [Helicobacter canadensis]EES89321.1 thiamine monophosphate synthase [Helicobacter canadensis MIT 98-5491]STO99356.1 thiamin-phosphate pyrophosphorylase [Helicobacter canadensis]